MATEARAMTAAKRGRVRDQRKVVCSRPGVLAVSKANGGTKGRARGERTGELAVGAALHQRAIAGLGRRDESALLDGLPG